MEQYQHLIEQGLMRRTPLIPSPVLSQLCNAVPVYLKLDLLQPSGSFKDRGMAYLIHYLAAQGVRHLISSSGGNAGLAVATVGQKLHLPVDVIVPETTTPLVIAKLNALGATVTVHGANWNAADELARQMVHDRTGAAAAAAYMSPYDHEWLWTGHSSVVHEVVEQLAMEQLALGTMIVSVGGGGLLCGTLEALANVSGDDDSVQVVAAETHGAASFAAAWRAQDASVRLDRIDSIATSLGALQITPVALARAQAHQNVVAVPCTDAEAVQACLQLAADHKLLVEPACGAALASLYTERLRQQVLAGHTDCSKAIVVEVCGGSGVNVELLAAWKAQFEL